MGKEYLTVCEVTNQLRDELMLKDLTDSNVRIYADYFLEIDRGKDNNYRMFDEEAIKKLKKGVIFCELGVSKEDVKDFFNKTITVPILVKMTQKIHNSKSNLIPIAEKALAEFTFESQPIIKEE